MIDLSDLGTAGAAVLTALAVGGGVLFKKGQDKRDARDEAQAKADEAAEAKAQTNFAQVNEMLNDARTELRAAQADITKLRADALDLWGKMGAMRQTLNAYEAHIAAWNRWADAGSTGPRPAPITGALQ